MFFYLSKSLRNGSGEQNYYLCKILTDFDSLSCAFGKHSFHLNKDLPTTLLTQTLLDYYSVIHLKPYYSATTVNERLN